MRATFVEHFSVKKLIKQDYFLQLTSNIETEICEIEPEKSTHPLIYNIKHTHIGDGGEDIGALYRRSHTGVINIILIRI